MWTEGNYHIVVNKRFSYHIILEGDLTIIAKCKGTYIKTLEQCV